MNVLYHILWTVSGARPLCALRLCDWAGTR